MHALVTGAAGFIGSHLVDALVAAGWDVRGVDRRPDDTNVEAVRGAGAFELVVDDLVDGDLAHLLDGIDVVFHLAGQPGVRSSWGDEFGAYVSGQRARHAAPA